MILFPRVNIKKYNRMLKNYYDPIYFRSNEKSLIRGVTSEESYIRTNKRRLVSLKICFMTWIYELIGTAFTIFTPLLHQAGVQYVNYPDAILVFILIPLIHLMNDEDTKTIIIEEGSWLQGLRHMLGIRHQVQPSP